MYMPVFAGYHHRRSTRMLLILWLVDRDDVCGRHRLDGDRIALLRSEILRSRICDKHQPGRHSRSRIYLRRATRNPLREMFNDSTWSEEVMLAVIIADQGIFPTVRTTSFIPNPGVFADGPALGRKGPEPLKNVPPERCILGVP